MASRNSKYYVNTMTVTVSVSGYSIARLPWFVHTTRSFDGLEELEDIAALG